MRSRDDKLGTLVTHTYVTLMPTAWHKCDTRSCHDHANSVALNRTITNVEEVYMYFSEALNREKRSKEEEKKNASPPAVLKQVGNALFLYNRK